MSADNASRNYKWAGLLKVKAAMVCRRCGALVPDPDDIPLHDAWHARIDAVT